MIDLKPCPFCGDTAMYYLDPHYDDKHVIECEYCGVCVREEHSETDAINAWNNRPDEDQLRAELEKLKSALNESLSELESYERTCGKMSYTRSRKKYLKLLKGGE